VFPAGAPALFLLLVLLLSPARAEDIEWPLHGLDSGEQRFSPLELIDRSNVSQLGLAWSLDTPYRRGLEATPIVVDGVMYLTINWSEVYAIDPVSGELLWHYDPQVPREWAKMACCDVVNRGVAVADGKVVFGTLDARLIALDATTGKKLWEVQTADITVWPYTITGAPRIAKGKVFIGNGGAEYGVRGFVSAFDLDTGDLAWRFYTVPGNPADGFEHRPLEEAARTWSGQWWERGGGGTVWDSIVYDEELDQLYIGVGNGSPWNRELRSPGGGDNLYLSSIVALNPDTGQYIWHYQETPAESWDYTATQHIMLANMEWQGRQRKVIWHAPKNGFFFIIDRLTGEMLSAEPFARVNWTSGYDMSTGRPIETEVADYSAGPQLIRPGPGGAHNWHPMAYSPQTGYVYIPVMDSPVEYRHTDRPDYEWGHWNTGAAQSQPGPESTLLTQMLGAKTIAGYLLAWDPASQQPAWSIRRKLGTNGGLLATAGGLLFQGTGDGEVQALDAATGDILWRYGAQVGVIAPPVTYSIDGEQYLTVLAGWGGAFGIASGLPTPGPLPPSRVLTFKLGAKSELPRLEQAPELQPLPPRPAFSQEVFDRGNVLYHEYCYMCHGNKLASNQAIPDLRNLPMPFYERFDDIVLEGIMAKAGMVGFSDVLSTEDVDAIYAYVVEGAYRSREETGDGWWPALKRWFFGVFASVIAWLDSLQ
jgi:quinohemoprotein ethanol dehydrogenase